jgi:alkylation response protein AidB-like acyl-CoA dehydrogenase
MSEYVAPLRDMQFVLRELAQVETLSSLPGFEDATPDLAEAILEEAAKFATNVLSPLNISGDREGVHWDDGQVFTAKGWKEAYRQFIDGGWNGLSGDPTYGGQGLPRLISALVEEMWNGANTSFALCPMLTAGFIESVALCGTDLQKQTWLPKLVSGEWTGTMVLTESQAGSDLSAVRTRAVPQADGSYRLHGQKIYITYGEHDMTDNIVHLVLARTPDAPEGVKGISLFIVPKFLLNADGSPGLRNDVRCVSTEHKLGIHASPTCVLAFGDNAGATGWLVGEENRGLEYMFITMNAARYSVGIEGIGLSERAYQRALRYARDRIQGTEAGSGKRERVSILRHPDVRRMLMEMKAYTEAMRALACVVGAAIDVSHAHADASVRAAKQKFVDLMIPVVKGWSTETAIHVASIGVQVHGGMGFIEETGAAQHLRDARITAIYEGTTCIQALDLIGRKVARDGGTTIREMIMAIHDVEVRIRNRNDEQLTAIANQLSRSTASLEVAVDFIVANYGSDIRKAAAGAVPFLELVGIVAGGWQMARAADVALTHLASGDGDKTFYQGKLLTARFYADHILPRSEALAHCVVNGADAALAMHDDAF